ncbi:MAG TPA: D-alanine--D-alanine ligase family protein [Candidatus Saccharimonadales bacterium]
MESQSEKPVVAVFAGARSTEHEVSLLSAHNIVNAIDTNKYDVVVIGIDKQGIWKLYDAANFVDNPGDITKIKLSDQPISGRLAVTQSSHDFYDIENDGKVVCSPDITFPALLGNYSEDGTMQGLLRIMDVPFTTADVVGSSVGMDKDISYRLLRDAGLNVAPFITLRKGGDVPAFQSILEQLEADLIFVKPANAGSSVGVSRVTSEAEYLSALELAFRYDVKVLVQKGIVGREVEISVMGLLGQQKTSVVGEIIEHDPNDFYSYANKYVIDNAVDLVAPAEMSDELYQKISEAAKKTCEALEIENFARVDFFVTPDETVYINEPNTMPGFTAISMFPRLWQTSGMTYPEIVDNLLHLAKERHSYRIDPIVTDAKDIVEAHGE